MAKKNILYIPGADRTIDLKETQAPPDLTKGESLKSIRDRYIEDPEGTWDTITERQKSLLTANEGVAANQVPTQLLPLYMQEAVDPAMAAGSLITPPEGFGKSRFDKRITDWRDLQSPETLNEARARIQTGGSKIINGIAKAGVLTATGVVDGAVGFLGGVIQMMYDASTGKWDDVLDKEGNKVWSDPSAGQKALNSFRENFITRNVLALNDLMEKALPNYMRADESDRNFLSQLGTANFWGNEIFKGIGYIASGLLTGKIVSGWMVPKLTGVNKVREVLKTAQTVAGMKRELKTGGEAMNLARAFASGRYGAEGQALAKSLAGASRRMTATQIVTRIVGSGTAALGEGRLISHGAQQQYYESAKAKLEAMRQRDLSHIDRDLIYEYPGLFMRVKDESPANGMFPGRMVTVVREECREMYSRLYEERRREIEEMYSNADRDALNQSIRVGNAVFVQQLPIIFATDMIGWGAFLSGTWKTGRAASGFVRISKDGVAEASAAARNMKRVKGFAESLMGPIHMLGQGYSGMYAAKRGDVRMAKGFYGLAYDPELIEEYLNDGAGGKLLARDVWREYWKSGEAAKSLTVGFLFNFMALPNARARRSVKVGETRVEVGKMTDEQAVEFRRQQSDMGRIRKWMSEYTLEYSPSFVREWRESNRLYDEAREMAKTYNAYHQSDAFRAMWEGVMRGQAILKGKDGAIVSGDKNTALTATEAELLNAVMTFGKLRRIPELQRMMDDVAATPLEEMRELTRSRETGESPYDLYTEEEYADMVREKREALRRTIDDYAKYSRQIRTAFGTRLKEEDMVNMTWMMYHIDNLNRRFNECYGKVYDFLFTRDGAPLKDVEFIKDEKLRGRVRELRDMGGRNALEVLSVYSEGEVMDRIREISDIYKRFRNEGEPTMHDEMVGMVNDLAELYRERREYANRLNKYTGDYRNVAPGDLSVEAVIQDIRDTHLMTAFRDPKSAEELKDWKNLAAFLKEVLENDDVLYNGMLDAESILNRLKTAPEWADYADAAKKAEVLFRAYSTLMYAWDSIYGEKPHGEGTVAADIRFVLGDAYLNGEVKSAEALLQPLRDRAADTSRPQEERDEYAAIVKRYDDAMKAKRLEESGGEGEGEGIVERAGHRKAGRKKGKDTERITGGRSKKKGSEDGGEKGEDEAEGTDHEASEAAAVEAVEKPAPAGEPDGEPVDETAGREAVKPNVVPDSKRLEGWTESDAMAWLSDGRTSRTAVAALYEQCESNRWKGVLPDVKKIIVATAKRMGLTETTRELGCHYLSAEATARAMHAAEVEFAPKAEGNIVFQGEPAHYCNKAYRDGGDLASAIAIAGRDGVRVLWYYDPENSVINIYGIVRDINGSLKIDGKSYSAVVQQDVEFFKRSNGISGEIGKGVLEGYESRVVGVSHGDYDIREGFHATEFDPKNVRMVTVSRSGQFVLDGSVFNVPVHMPEHFNLEGSYLMLICGADGKWTPQQYLGEKFSDMMSREATHDSPAFDKLNSFLAERLNLLCNKGARQADRYVAANEVMTLFECGGMTPETLLRDSESMSVGDFQSKVIESVYFNWSPEFTKITGISVKEAFKSGLLSAGVSTTTPHFSSVSVSVTPPALVSGVKGGKGGAWLGRRSGRAAALAAKQRTENSKAQEVDRQMDTHPQARLKGASEQTVGRLALGMTRKDSNSSLSFDRNYITITGQDTNGNTVTRYFEPVSGSNSTFEELEARVRNGDLDGVREVLDPERTHLLDSITAINSDPEKGTRVDGSGTKYRIRGKDGVDYVYDRGTGELVRVESDALDIAEVAATDTVEEVDVASALNEVQGMLKNMPERRDTPAAEAAPDPETAERREGEKRDGIERRKEERKTGSYDPAKRDADAAADPRGGKMAKEYAAALMTSDTDPLEESKKILIGEGYIDLNGRTAEQVNFKEIKDAYDEMVMEHNRNNPDDMYPSSDSFGTLKDFKDGLEEYLSACRI